MKRTIMLGLLATLALGHAQAQQTPAPTPAPAPSTSAAQPRPAAATSSYIALGRYYYGQQNFDAAYIAFRAAAEAEPGHADALLGLGRTQVKLRLYAPGIETLRRLTTVDKGNVSGYIALSDAYVEQYVGSTDRNIVRNNLDNALQVLANAETVAQASNDKNLNLAKVWNQRAYVYRLRGEPSRAIEAANRALGFDPDNATILFNLGGLYYDNGNLTAAVDSLQRAVIADPGDAYSRAYYAKLLALGGNVSSAKAEAAQAARLAPNSAYAVGQYGVVSYLAKDGATARTQLNAAIKIDPLRYPEFYYYLGRLSLDGNLLAEARANFTKATALGSTNPEYFAYLGMSYERNATGIPADRFKARDAYQRALQLQPNYKLAQDGLNRTK